MCVLCVRLQEEKKQEQPNYTDYIYSHLFNHHPPGDVWQAVVVVLCLEEEEARMIRTCAMASKKNPVPKSKLNMQQQQQQQQQE